MVAEEGLRPGNENQGKQPAGVSQSGPVKSTRMLPSLLQVRTRVKPLRAQPNLIIPVRASCQAGTVVQYRL